MALNMQLFSSLLKPIPSCINSLLNRNIRAYGLKGRLLNNRNLLGQDSNLQQILFKRINSVANSLENNNSTKKLL